MAEALTCAGLPRRDRRSTAPLRQAYREFLAAFVATSREFRDVDRSVVFPAGCFPPRLSYQPYSPEPRSAIAGVSRF